MRQLLGREPEAERVLSVLRLLVAGALLVSCGSDDPAAPRDRDNDRVLDEDSGDSNEDLGGDGSNVDFEQPGGKPSGANVRVVNVYTPLNGDPGPIDAYGHAWATPSDRPLTTVPYEGVSDFFDPGVFGNNGDAFLSLYWDGTSGDGNALISLTETLKGDEVLTYVVATGSAKQDSGRRFAATQAFDHHGSMVPFGVETETAGKTQLVVTSYGLDQVLESPRDSNLFVSFGDGCEKALGDQDFSLTSVGPGTSGVYLLDPGTYQASLHEYDTLDQNVRTCDNTPVLQDLEFEAVADQNALLVIYAPEDGDLRWLFVPLEDP